MSRRNRHTPPLVIAVTGGARGIGAAIAGRLSASGHRVAIGDLVLADAQAAAERLDGESLGALLDVTDSGSITAFIDQVEAHFGPIDVFVNNAGVMWVGSFDQESESTTKRQFTVNALGVISAVRIMAPRMRERGRGQIVTVASAASKLAPPGEATYAATKHAIYGYLSAVREELRGSGVQLSVVMPTVVETALAVGTSSGSVQRLTPEDVASAVEAVIRRPRFEVSVPGYVDPLVRLVALLPTPIRAAVHRRMVPNQVAALTESSSREQYERTALAPSHHEGESQ